MSASNSPVTFVWSPDVFPKLMFPLAKIFPVAVISPSAVILPVTLRPSLILTIEESSALIDVPPNLKPLAVTPPVPDPDKTRSAFEALAVIWFPVIVTCFPKGDYVYNSVKFALILLNAVLNGSPVPSLAVVPILIVCCAIVCYPLYDYLFNILQTECKFYTSIAVL